MLDIIKQSLIASVFVIPAEQHRHFCKKLLMIIIAINLTFFTAVSMAQNENLTQKNGNFGVYSENGSKSAAELPFKIKNHISSTVNYYVRSNNDSICEADGSLAHGTLPAAASSPSETSISSSDYSKDQYVIFCTTCDDSYLVYNQIDQCGCGCYDGVCTEGAMKHMNIYCTNGEDCNNWGDDSYADATTCDT